LQVLFTAIRFQGNKRNRTSATNAICTLGRSPNAAQSAYSLALNTGRKHDAKPLTPRTNRLMANVDPQLSQHVLDIPQAKLKLDIHSHYKMNHLRP